MTDGVGGRRAWLEIGAAIASGGILALAYPPIGWWPFALIGWIPLLVVLRRVGPRRALLLGGLAGFLLAFTTCHWTWSMERFTVLPAALRPVATMVLVFSESLVEIGWAWSAVLLSTRFGVNRTLALTLCFSLSEVLLGSPFFPNFLSLPVWGVWPLTQLAEVGGAPAASALVMLINIVILNLGEALWRRRMPGLAARVEAAVLALLLLGSYLRGSYVAAAWERAEQKKVGMVQPNPLVWQEMTDAQMRAHIQGLSSRTSVLFARGADLVVWPETSWPGIDQPRPIGSIGPPVLRTLVTGTGGRLLVGNFTQATPTTLHNTAILLEEGGRIADRYLKVRLVPFFEYIPLKQEFPAFAAWLTAVLPRRAPVDPGPERTLLESGPFRISPMICVEELFPDYTPAYRNLKPNLLVGIASNGWVDQTGTPQQQLGLASFRAIEQRRDLVHVADSGISATVDAVGRLRARGPLPSAAQNTVIATEGEVALLEIPALGPTTVPYFPWACGGVLLGAALWARRGRARAADPAPASTQEEARRWASM